jgi:hypothetical protein
VRRSEALKQPRGVHRAPEARAEERRGGGSGLGVLGGVAACPNRVSGVWRGVSVGCVRESICRDGSCLPARCSTEISKSGAEGNEQHGARLG